MTDKFGWDNNFGNNPARREEQYDRNIRYQVEIQRRNGSTDRVSYFSRRDAALRRAKFIAGDKAGWPSVAVVRLIDTRSLSVLADFIRPPRP